ncbi:MAG TPA: hypothetical protein VN729_09360 [Ktedonobacteraceae bacterium]|nr:hypothetical protein [Ktedonobacteraceae bacterium]
MRKKTIAIFYIIGLVVVIIGSIMYGIGIASAVNDVNNATSAATVSTGSAGTLVIAGIILFIGGIFSFISWLGSLIAVGKQGRWGWFVCIFLFSYIAELVYLIAGPALGSKVSMAG